MEFTVKSTHGVIRFSLKESIKKLEANPKKESLIMLHFSSKGERFKKSIGFKCSLHHWDTSRQRVKTGKGMLVNAYKINAFINDLQSFTEEELTNMVKSDNCINLNKLSTVVGYKIKGLDSAKEKIEQSQLVNYSLNLVESKKRLINITTYRAYKQTIKQLKNYEKQNDLTLTFDDINLSFYRKFVTQLEKENFSLNTIGKHIKSLKTFLNDAFINGISTNVIFKNRNFKVHKETTTDIFLTKEEINMLAQKDFSSRPRIELARDIFLIGCYTGQRVSDYNGLTENNIEIIGEKRFIKIKQQKTNAPVHIPITSEIQTIMDRYGNKFPPKLSEPILRRNIKTACSTAGFKEFISVSYTKGGVLIKKQVPKYKLVKIHTARRSFCTNNYIAGKRIQDIMLFSGHKTEREFYK